MSAAEEAIDNYLIWELCKQESIQEVILEDSVDREELKRIIEKVKKKYQKKDYSFDEKKEKLQELDSNPDYRTEVFENCSWTKETVKVEELGTTLPRAGDLPPEAITGTLSEVVEFVEQAEPDEYESVKYVMRLREVSEVLNEFYPWVVTPGKRMSKLDRLNRVRGEKDWDVVDTWGMISEGNHRAIAKILASNSEEIECFVGHREVENS